VVILRKIAQLYAQPRSAWSIQKVENLLPVIRNAARALILRDHRILVLRKEYEDGSERYALPGGAQDPGETLQQALNRECEEEIGTPVKICDLVHVADYFKPRDTQPPSTKHLVEFLFECTVPEDYAPMNGHHPDKHQIEVVWVGLGDLEGMPLYPRSLGSYIQRLQNGSQSVYLGLIE